MVFIGSIDQGTSSTRFLVFDSKTAKVSASSQLEVSHITPKSGWLEEDPLEIYQTVVQTIKNVLNENPEIKSQGIASIGITNQRESTVLWDKETGQPLYNAIIWCDGRTQETVQKIKNEQMDNADFEESLKKLTGLPISTYFSAVKIRWMIDNVPEVKQSIQNETCMFGTIDTWLIYKLSAGKVHATDATNASRTLLYDINTNRWNDELVSIFKVEGVKLPEIKSSSCVEFCEIEDRELEELKQVRVTGVQRF